MLLDVYAHVMITWYFKPKLLTCQDIPETPKNAISWIWRNMSRPMYVGLITLVLPNFLEGSILLLDRDTCSTRAPLCLHHSWRIFWSKINGKPKINKIRFENESSLILCTFPLWIFKNDCSNLYTHFYAHTLWYFCLM